ncbi:fibroblast growth factor-binding protein 2 [Lepisosteus oculatus]|nr:PREDICTED: fibroblast growth factor-binding protein 2 [Lepisosteus oculatus]
MKAWARAVLCVACCVWLAAGQSKRSGGEELIRFSTKSKDACAMTVGGQGEVKLRVVCRNQGKSYWCEYVGQPSVCRSFNANPKQYWNQISSELRKTTHACQGTAVLKPSMCQKAPADAHMKQVAVGPKPASQKPVKTAQEKPAQSKPAKKLPKPPKTATAQPTLVPSSEADANKMAQEYCWESLQGVCAYFINLFKG